MHESGQIVACYEGLALPRDSFCLSEGFRFTPDYSELLDTKFLVAHLPDGDALVLQGNTTSRAGGDITLGWITFENRVITHLEFNAAQTSTPVATPTPTATPTRAQSASDRAVLIALYHSTGGANWVANANWLSDRPIGEWHGVTTDSNGRVVWLELGGNQLTGEIPPELGGLSNLTGLVLYGNGLTGEIPPELGRLSNLTRLDLGDNQLAGEIPPELGRLSNLRELGLGFNQLTGEIPPELGRLSNLTSLTFDGNGLTGEIPPELGGLSNLNHLVLGGNPLTGCIPEGLRDIEHNDLVELNLPDCGAATTVTSLGVAEMTPLTSIGEMVPISVTANMSDGSSQVVESGLVQWQSSDPWVASVSNGIVTSVGAGNAMITATYEGRNVEALVSVRISTRSTGTVRVIYAAPSDREFRADASEGIAHAIVDLQSWYRRELGGLTFSIYEATPEVCRMSEPEAYYESGNAWARVVEGVQPCAPVEHGHPDFVWVIYPDVEEACDEPHELGAGRWGLTILPDIEGITNPGKEFYRCGERSYFDPIGRWIGGLGHELGHALGLPHPPGCDPWDPATCDDLEALSLMHDGYTPYPDTYLLPDDKEILIRSPLIGRGPASALDSFDAPNASTLQGVALGLDGEPVEGLRVSLVAETFWSWGETGRDGTFEIRLPEGSSGPSILSIHAGGAGDCGWLGYHGPDGVTTARTQATRVEIAGGNVTGMEIRLPVNLDDLCSGQRKVSGIVLGPDGRPVEGIGLEAVDEWLQTGVDGTFDFAVPEGWVGSPVLGIYAGEIVPGCDLVGYYGPGGFTTLFEEAWLEIGVLGATGIEIRLPATPDDLCSRQSMVSGAVLGPDGETVAGIWIELTAEALWQWGVTGQDGTFKIRLLDGWSGSYLLSIYADEVVPGCGLVGFYGPGGFTTLREEATRVEVGDADVTGIEIRLPASPDDLCNRQE